MQEQLRHISYPSKRLGLIVLLLCLMPAFLNNFGVDFGSISTALDTPNLYGENGRIVEDILLPSITGPLQHALLEWTAVIIAMLTVFLAFSYFSIAKDMTTPIIGMALFFSGTADAFHTLSSLHLFSGIANNAELMPFTWSLSRIFNSCILIISVLFALGFSTQTRRDNEFRTIALVCILFAVAAYVFNHLASVNMDLPQSIYPDSNIPRPFDLIPLVLFIIAIPIFIVLHKKQKNCLTLALLLSLIPQIILEMHMALRSTALYDNDFNIAHILKIVAYLMPLFGIIILYIQTYKSLEESQNELEHALDKLDQANEELEQFAYAASHDLQEPLRMVSSFTSLLERDYAHKLDETGREYIAYATSAAQRMQELVVDLLTYSRLGQEAVQYGDVDCNTIMEIVLKNLTEPIYETKAKIEVSYLPVIYGNKVNIMRVFQNIVANALKYTNPNIPPLIRISCTEENNMYVFRIQDNGIGFDPKQSDRIFKAFKRLHTQAKYPGSGIGLTMCKKVINAHGGKIWAEGEIDKGCIFRFTIPKAQKQSSEQNGQN